MRANGLSVASEAVTSSSEREASSSSKGSCGSDADTRRTSRIASSTLPCEHELTVASTSSPRTWVVNGAEMSDFGRAARPHRSVPLGRGWLSGSFRVGSAAVPREGQSQEARIVSCGATKRPATVKAAVKAGCQGHCQHAGRTSMIDSTLRPASHESISFDWRGVSLSLKKHACTV